MHLPFLLKFSAFRGFTHRLMYLWIKRYGLITGFIFLIILGLGVYQWYTSLVWYRWTEDEKNAYLERTIEETAFQEDTYKQALDSVAVLREEHTRSLPIKRDYFIGKRKETK